MKKKYITRTELAALLGKSENTVARWQRKGCPHKIHVGKERGKSVRPLFNVRDVKKWLIAGYLQGLESGKNSITDEQIDF